MPLHAVEINRKLIHLSSLWMPVAAFCMDQQMALISFGILMAFILAIEVARIKSEKCSALFSKVFGGTLRQDEREKKALTGAGYMMIGVWLSLLFPKEIAVTAMTVLMVPDTAAALVGQKIGSVFFMGKSLEGCLAFFASGLGVLLIVGMTVPHGANYYIAGTAGVLAATAAEIYSRKLRLDDNLTIPMAVCLTMFLLS